MLSGNCIRYYTTNNMALQMAGTNVVGGQIMSE